MRNRYERNAESLIEMRDKCAVSDLCEGICRDIHLNREGNRCPAWYTDDMDKRKKQRRGGGRRR